MCGLAGFIGKTGTERARQYVVTMLHAEKHRGPDADGIWTAEIGGSSVGLGLARLKILDLSDSANQPMISEGGRFVLVYNGELYNYVELRAQLTSAGAIFRTRGDTEVVLQALIAWGSMAFTRFNGMWALLLLDRTNGKILLSRDRFGIKPLYTYADERGVFVSSEIKAILVAADRKFRINAEVADAYLHQNLLCTGRATFFGGIEEFPAGHFADCSLNELGAKRLDPSRYWTIPTSYSGGRSECDLVEAVRDTFLDSVKIRLRSDVPLGILLSGGLDSSAIAASVYQIDSSTDKIKLISAVDQSGNYDEQPFIDIVARHLKRPVDKVVLNYPYSEALEMISEVSWFNDEPIASFSTVAHYLLMKKARALGVTVLLSGQGADESLCGYRKYLGFYLQELIRAGKVGAAAKTFLKFVQQGTVISQFNYREAKRYLPQWLRFSEIDIRGRALLEANATIHVGLNGAGVIDRQVTDFDHLSIPALVHYEDRMSMAVAREIRLPFLDYRLVTLLVSLPIEYKLRDGWTKWIFRRAMETLLPKEITWRKDKQHFIVPQNHWFRSELRGHVAKLLEEEWLSENLGFIDRRKLRDLYRAYLKQRTEDGQLNFKDIFCPIAFELWARRYENYLTG
jgi:asparagine synthase (glutamine-hydrolysing)